MGVHENIGYDKFPDQGGALGQRVAVCFNFDYGHTLPGIVVRDDREAPYRLIIKLDDGRYVMATECQYRDVK
jgi:hypothetical protein